MGEPETVPPFFIFDGQQSRHFEPASAATGRCDETFFRYRMKSVERKWDFLSRTIFGDDLPVVVRLPGGNHDADGEDAQGIGHGLGALGGILSPVEGEGVRAPLALAVDVDAAHLVDQGVHQLGKLVRVPAEDARLLAVIGVDHVLDGFADVVVGNHRNHRAELLLAVEAHLRGYGVEERRVEEGTRRPFRRPC